MATIFIGAIMPFLPKKQHRLFLIQPVENRLSAQESSSTERVRQEFIQTIFDLDELLDDEDIACEQS